MTDFEKQLLEKHIKLNKEAASACRKSGDDLNAMYYSGMASGIRIAMICSELAEKAKKETAMPASTAAESP